MQKVKMITEGGFPVEERRQEEEEEEEEEEEPERYERLKRLKSRERRRGLGGTTRWSIGQRMRRSGER